MFMGFGNRKRKTRTLKNKMNTKRLKREPITHITMSSPDKLLHLIISYLKLAKQIQKLNGGKRLIQTVLF